MRNVFVRLACLLIMLALVLTGCSLIEIDPIVELEENMEAMELDYNKVIVTYNGGTLTKGDLMADFYYQYSYFAYMYAYYYGTSLTEDDSYSIAQSVAEGFMNTIAVLMKAEEMGITLTDEEIAACEEYAQTKWQEDYDAAYATAEGETEEERKLHTEYTLASQGVSYEYYYHQYEWDLIITKVEEIITADAPVLNDDELLAALAEQAMEDEKTYTANTTAFETAMLEGNVMVTWIPEGYRTVKHILLIPEDEVLLPYIDTRNEINAANSEMASLTSERLKVKNGEGERTLEEVEADIDAKQAELDELNAKLDQNEADCIANVDEQLDEIYARLEAGEDFDAVMAEYGKDPGMAMEPSMSDGYYVCATSETWDYSFRNGAMALENVGDYSAEPVVSASGVHIIYYNSDVKGGLVALDDVREEFTASAQQTANSVYFNELCVEWVNELNPQYNIDNFFAE